MPEHQSMLGLKIADAPADLDVIGLQAELQDLIGRDSTPAVTQGELIDRLRLEKEAVDNEWAEVWSQLPWKHWSAMHRGRREDLIGDELRTELAFELVDIFHFLLNCAIALGMTWQEFLNIYLTKNIENRARQHRGY